MDNKYQYNYDVAIREREILLVLIDQILSARKKTARGGRSLLNADFNMLFPYVWKLAPDNVPEYKDYGKNLIELLSDHPKDTSEFSVYFTLPSFLELLDSFHHHARNAEYLLGQTKTYEHFQNAEFNKIIFDESSISSGQAEKELKRIRSIAKSHEVQRGLDRAVELIGRDGRISGVDDLIHEGIHYNKRDVNLFNSIFQDMKDARSSKDKREEKDKYFHYKVDAANIVTTRIVSNLEGVNSMFVTHQSMIDHHCKDMGLNAQMPYLWLSAHLLCKHSKDKFGEDVDQFLKTMQKMMKESLSILIKYNGKPIPSNYQNLVDLVHNDFLEPIHRRPNQEPKTKNISETEKYDNSYESYVKLKGNLEETRDTLGKSVKDLASNVPFILDSETMSVFKLDEDDMVSEIRKDFGV